MGPKAPALLVVLVETERRRWFVAAVDLDGTATPLLRSESGDLDRYLSLDFDEQVAFLRHRICGILQRGCDRLWGRHRKACQFVLVFESPLPPDGELTRAVAEHFALWMLNPPVAVLVAADGFDGPGPVRLDAVGGDLDASLGRLVRDRLGDLLGARRDPDAWEVARRNDAWC